MTDQFIVLKKKYTYNVPAAALFFSNAHKALRVEVPDIGKEFTDSAYIGKDPEGFIYYNHLDSFEGKIKYTISKLINNDGHTLAHIKFYRDSPDACHAEFLAEDPTGSVAGANMDGWSATGTWTDLNIGCATASIRKYDDSKTITFTVGTIHRTATLTDTNNVLRGKSVKVNGNFFFKDINTIKDGQYASYNDDRIVFYKDNWVGTDFTGYFIAFEYSVEKLGIASNNTAIISGVSWV
ncbi:hypothetical protein PILCRDRAFT_826551 [Piloderma croceum F 1598]|uniref:Uncharacterized protein n=1 Tax=Piloderma croceum (strain F 1598) TaxID=765440 RepID=A0A0C3EUK5_PILCF|nr:hypothetical protein PILCRDRAFT_826551 [Piloderma croceum F 1598]